MLPDIQPGNTKILYFFNCLLDGMHTNYINLHYDNVGAVASRSKWFAAVLILRKLMHR